LPIGPALFRFGSAFALTLGLILLVPLVLIAMARSTKSPPLPSAPVRAG